MTRVQIPAYTDAWMKGDRFGTVVHRGLLATSRLPVRTRLLAGHRFDRTVEVAWILLDKSNKTVRVVFADCEVVS